ncbi:Geranylgeranyl transferase type-2 subunit alpha [Caligus rogercresseyi]|uniref:Geranylgeranyl transferase type-2 subunit alpha n=1 Tax=Caligus rogercresseyi TaxID=217165 RepID=A0A7T8JTI8_CALRO|nr:Geranylgeranyl transferase type-2 subunit alpha [Caligus rogercresseyi]
MHGRLKVKTTAQQEAERKAERASKMKSYEAAMSRLTEEMDEAFRLSSGLLLSNPDLTSLWNFRKEIYCGMNDEEREKSKVIRVSKTLELLRIIQMKTCEKAQVHQSSRSSKVVPRRIPGYPTLSPLPPVRHRPSTIL